MLVPVLQTCDTGTVVLSTQETNIQACLPGQQTLTKPCSFYYYLFIFKSVHVCSYVSRVNVSCACGGQRTLRKGQFPPSTLWVPGIELRSPGSARNLLAAEPSGQPNPVHFYLLCYFTSLALRATAAWSCRPKYSESLYGMRNGVFGQRSRPVPCDQSSIVQGNLWETRSVPARSK